MRKSDQDIAKERNEFVVISNQLIRMGNYDLTAQQLKIMLYIISKIRPNDEYDTWYTIKIVDLCRCCGIKVNNSGTYYKRLKTDMKKLTFRSWFSLPGSEWESSISWIGDVTMNAGSGMIKVCFNPFMAPFLFHLKENYTQYELQKILTFTSRYSIRVYMLLKSFIYQSKLENNIPQGPTLALDKLRSSLVTKGYEDWRDFHKRVLSIALEEINTKSDEFHVEIETLKEDRNKVEKIHFIITAADAVQASLAQAIREEKFADV